MLIIGSHVSFGTKQLLQSVTEAVSYNADTFMFYTGAPQNTIRKDIDDTLTLQATVIMQENKIDINNVICHAPYIVNPATNDPEKREFAINFLKQEISRCVSLGVKYLVLHPGSSVNITKEEGLDNIITVLNSILDNQYDVTILLETMAGKGNERGITTDELAYLINNVNDNTKLGVCIDTCHLNDAGIDLTSFDKYLDDFDQKIGVSRIKCVHVNDSKNPFNYHKDRHANIGFGTIGFDTLSNIIYNPRLDNIPKILETPYVGDTDDAKEKKYPPYKYEIAMIRNKTFDNELLDKIRKAYKKN